jgi:regulator of protease activity HflC (stomatin/prohibitin superfamily)
MRLITVNANEVGLVVRRGRVVNIFMEGRYWLWTSGQVIRYSLTQPVSLAEHWITYLENDQIRKMINVVEIADHEIGLEMKDGRFTRVIQPGKVGYWKSPVKYEVEKLDLDQLEVPSDIPRYILHNPAVLAYLRVFSLDAYQKGLLHVDGEYIKELGPGVYYYWKSEKVIQVKIVDTRTLTLNVLGQEILTKDKAGIRVNFSSQYRVLDIETAIVDTRDYEAQLYTAFQLALREYIGRLTLDQLLLSKEAVGPYIVEATEDEAALLGLQVLSGGIKDIILPGDVKEIMNQVLIAQKKAQANTIMRHEETASTRSLLNTAKLMEENVMLLKLKEMEYMEKIADKIGEITVNGGGGVIDQLRDLMVTK